MDKRNERFKKGEQVKVINPYNNFFDELAKVLMYDVPKSNETTKGDDWK